jgi:hypothetical protein
MASLRSQISKLSDEFAAGVFRAIRNASLDEVLRITGASRSKLAAELKVPVARKTRTPKTDRLERRSDEELAALLDKIVALLQKNPKGLRAEHIRDELRLIPKELPRPLADGLAQKRISRQGQKRATTYFAGKKTSK